MDIKKEIIDAGIDIGKLGYEFDEPFNMIRYTNLLYIGVSVYGNGKREGEAVVYIYDKNLGGNVLCSGSVNLGTAVYQIEAELFSLKTIAFEIDRAYSKFHDKVI